MNRYYCKIAAPVLMLTAVTLQGQTTPKTPAKPTLGTASWVVPVDAKNAVPSPNPSPKLKQEDWWNFSWQTFIALNWPAVPPSAKQVPGIPDTTQKLGATAGTAFIPTVWLTYSASSTLFLANGQDPGAWGMNTQAVPSNAAPLPPGSVAPGFGPMLLDTITKSSKHFGHFNDGSNEASGNPLIDQAGHYVVYDIRLNQSEYTYIYQNKYYNADAQKAAFAPGGPGFKGFPRTGSETTFNPPLPQLAQFGASEVKASWRVLRAGKDDFSRYYTQTGYYIQPDGTCEGPVTFGLIGLHILRLTPSTPSTWFWATFEQIDNTTGNGKSKTNPTLSSATNGSPDGLCLDGGYDYEPANVTANVDWTFNNKPVNVSRTTAIPAAVQKINSFWQSQVAGTPWQYYQLIDAVNPPVAAGPSYSISDVFNTTAPNVIVNLPVLANTSMETYSQRLNCVSCHGAAAPIGAPKPLTSANQIFTFLLGDADSPSTKATKPRSPIKLVPLK